MRVSIAVSLRLWAGRPLRHLDARLARFVLYSTFLISHFELFGLTQVVSHFLGHIVAPMKFKTPGLDRTAYQDQRFARDFPRLGASRGRSADPHSSIFFRKAGPIEALIGFQCTEIIETIEAAARR
jgi:hypothetical protein